MTGRRVAVTGLGVISALGRSREEFWESLTAGESGIREISLVDRSRIGFGFAAEVQGFDPELVFQDRSDLALDRFAQFAQIAALEAVAQADPDWDDRLRTRSAVITGSCTGGQETMENSFHGLYREDRRRVHPLTVPRIMANAGASRISMALGLQGPCFTVSTACSSANHAIGLAFMLLRSGAADLAITGGSDAPISFGNLKAWEALRVVSPDTCRPFCKERNGMILGEGGAMLVLEPLDVARARGATILGEIVGFGMTSDAHHLTQPSLDGPVRALRAALDDAELDPTDVDYINAHGTATPGNDPNESAAIRATLGSHAEAVAVSSTKSMHGHTLGAAGALEAVATVLALRTGVVPPTANFGSPDPACNLDFVPNEARESNPRIALSNSFAFGGLNAVLAFRKHE